jgi:hypothetical protein
VVAGGLAAHCFGIGQVETCYNNNYCYPAGDLSCSAIPFLNYKMAAGENGSEQRTQIQNGGWDA